MALIKCKECGEEISDKATKCIHCGTILNNEESNNIISKITNKDFYSSCSNGVEKNINYFFKLANIIKKILFVLAGLLPVMGLMITGGADGGEILIPCIIGSVFIVITAILSTPFIEWKAYVLKQLYEINTKNKK